MYIGSIMMYHDVSNVYHVLSHQPPWDSLVSKAHDLTARGARRRGELFVLRELHGAGHMVDLTALVEMQQEVTRCNKRHRNK